LSLLGLSAPAAQSQATAPVGKSRPNVLFIAIDDLNDWVGPLGGHPQAKTPAMDRLARRGTTFTNAHCQSPLCNPSRTSVLSGLRPSTSGVYGLDPWIRTSPTWKDVVTLPQHFAANGYRTLTTGKIFHDAYPPQANRKDGSEFNVWGYQGSFAPRPPKKLAREADPHPAMDWGVFPERDEEHDDWRVADWAIGQLKQPQTQPFFLSVGIRHPHVPCYATQKWFDLYPDATLRMPPVNADDRSDTPRFSWYLHWKLPEPRLSRLKELDEWRPLVRSYLASISFADSQVDRVLNALEASGHADNTIVVLWSDHGWHLGEKGITGKNTLWERSTRVPLIMAGPGIKAGARCGRPAELLDLYPTLAEACGLPARSGLDGQSLVPQLQNPDAARSRPAVTTHGPGSHTARSENWRYIRYADGSEELYDVRKDPNEWTNLAGDPRHASRKRELARWLPKADARPLPGSKVRLIELRNGRPFWEGEPIGANDAIPGE
jgi:arylsulfatase A-like enzyme